MIVYCVLFHIPYLVFSRKSINAPALFNILPKINFLAPTKFLRDFQGKFWNFYFVTILYQFISS